MHDPRKMTWTDIKSAILEATKNARSADKVDSAIGDCFSPPLLRVVIHQNPGFKIVVATTKEVSGGTVYITRDTRV